MDLKKYFDTVNGPLDKMLVKVEYTTYFLRIFVLSHLRVMANI